MSSATSALSAFLKSQALAMLDEGVTPSTVAETVALWAGAHFIDSADYAALATALAAVGVTMPTSAQAAAVRGTRISKTVTANGTYRSIDDSAGGYSDVTVAIPHPAKTITANGTYQASTDGVAGWGEVTVSTVAYTHVALASSVSMGFIDYDSSAGEAA